MSNQKNNNYETELLKELEKYFPNCVTINDVDEAEYKKFFQKCSAQEIEQAEMQIGDRILNIKGNIHGFALVLADEIIENYTPLELADELRNIFGKNVMESDDFLGVVNAIINTPKKALSHIYPKFMTVEGNEDFLELVPYQPFLNNLVITFQFIVDVSEIEPGVLGSASYPILKEYLKVMNMDADIILKTAFANQAKRIPKISTGMEFLEPDVIATLSTEQLILEKKTRLITDLGAYSGINFLLDNELLSKIAEELNMERICISLLGQEILVITPYYEELLDVYKERQIAYTASFPGKNNFSDIYVYDNNNKKISILI